MDNDEPTYADRLDHDSLVEEVVRAILTCKPPYVIGICGPWGSGKTSFMRKLNASFGGACVHDGEEAQHKDFESMLTRCLGGPAGAQGKPKWFPVWFNPWQHQFEASPLVALLQEIRQHLSTPRKGWQEVKKLANVTTYTVLGMLPEMAKSLHIPSGSSVSGIEDRGRAYESEHFATVLSSQRFREFFEAAIAEVLGPNGRMVIFIDDLDRCEGEAAYRLLEALKLYLNAKNCVYVLGLDGGHLEANVARVISGKPDHDAYRPLARSYLNKMFQNLFLLPAPRSMAPYIRSLIHPNDFSLRDRLVRQFQFRFDAEWPEPLVQALDQGLPHNPRRVKSFLASWRLYLSHLASREPVATDLDWRLTLVLNYLGQFEEPIFRRIEESPDFYTGELLGFCRGHARNPPEFNGIQLPYGKPGQQAASAADESGGAETQGASNSPSPSSTSSEDVKPQAFSRTFWMRDLVLALSEIDGNIVARHLLGHRERGA